MANPFEGDDLFDKQSLKDTEKAIRASLRALEKQAAKTEQSFRQLANGLDTSLKIVKNDFEELQKSAKDNNQPLNENVSEAKKLAKELKELSTAYKENKSAQKELNNQATESVNTLDALKKRYKEVRLAASQADLGSEEFKKLSKEASALGEEIKQTNKQFRQAERINKSATGSYEALTLETRRLKQELKALPNAFDPANKKAQELKRQIAGNTQTLKDFDKSINESFRNVGNYESALDGLKGSFANIVAGITAGVAVVGGTVASFNALADAARQSAKELKLVNQAFGLSDAQLDNLTNKIRATAATFDKDFREVLQATNAAASQFGITGEDAINVINEGLIRGADLNEEFLDGVREYSTQFKEAGLSLEDLTQVSIDAAQQGVFSDKAVDTIKEATLRIRELTPATKDALNGIGLSGSEIQKQLENGERSIASVISEVSAQLKTLPADSAVVGTAIADIFGGPGEDAGLAFLKTLDGIGGGLRDAGREVTEFEKQSRRLLASQEGLEKAQNELLKQFQGVTKAADILANKSLASLINFTAKYVSILKESGKFVTENKDAFLAFGAALIALKAPLIASTAQTIADTIAKQANAAATVGLNRATQILKATFATTPFGAVLAVVSALAGVYLLLRDRTSSLNKEQQIFADGQEKVKTATDKTTDALDSEAAALEVDFEALKKTSKGTQERSDAIDTINEKYGQYLPNLLDETSGLKDIEKAQRAANDAILERILLEGQRSAIQEAIQDRIKAQREVLRIEKELQNIERERIAAFKTPSGRRQSLAFSQRREAAQEQLRAENAAIREAEGRVDRIRDEFDEIRNRFGIDPAEPEPVGASGTTPSGDSAASERAKKEQAERLATLEELRKKRAELFAELEKESKLNDKIRPERVEDLNSQIAKNDRLIEQAESLINFQKESEEISKQEANTEQERLDVELKGLDKKEVALRDVKEVAAPTDEPTFLSKLIDEADILQSSLNELAGQNETIRKLLALSELLQATGNIASGRSQIDSSTLSLVSRKEGGYTRKGHDNQVNSLRIVEDHANEWYASAGLVRDERAAPIIQALDAYQSGRGELPDFGSVEKYISPVVQAQINTRADIDYDKIGQSVAKNITVQNLEPFGEHLILTKERLNSVERTIHKQRGKPVKGSSL